jgi:uncharacterized protein YjbJ (UPF0337 family)
MENSRFEGLGHQVKGVVKQRIGKAIGDAKLVADGTAERTIGDQQVAAGGLGSGGQMFGIDTGRVRGVVNQLRGALMQSVGSLVGNPKLQSEGVVEQRAGKAQNEAGSDRDAERDVERAAAQSREAAIDPGAPANPLKAAPLQAEPLKAEPIKAEPFKDGSMPWPNSGPNSGPN